MKVPENIDWASWVDRWDRMQERYIVKRAKRFEAMIRLIQGTQTRINTVLDLGCGTGSLMLKVLEAFPEAQVTGLDFDPTLLWLAKARLERFGDRACIKPMDLRQAEWTGAFQGLVDAVVSATALHWFSPAQLDALYGRIASVLKPGGIFLNADHVGSAHSGIQKVWEQHRSEMRRQEGKEKHDDWEGFWKAYSKTLGLDIDEIHKRVMGEWEGGVEDGLPLSWHFEVLQKHGFDPVDCFWRCDCDAIYGGVKKMTKLIFIGGAPGVGKSTVAKELFKTLDNAVWLDGDDLWRMHPFIVNDETRKMVEDNIVYVLNAFIRAHYSYIIFTWVLHQDGIAHSLLERLDTAGCDFAHFTLVCDEKTLIKRMASDVGRTTDVSTALDRLKQSLMTSSETVDTEGVSSSELAVFLRDRVLL